MLLPHSCWTVWLSVCIDFLAMPVVLLPLFLLPPLFDFLPLCCSYIQTARSHCVSKSNFFLYIVLPLGWVVGDEWMMNLKGYGWKHMCPNVVIRCTGRAGGVWHYEGQHAWRCARWQRSWYSGEICFCQLTFLQRVAQLPLYCSFTWKHCALVNYMLLCLDLTWSQHGTCSTCKICVVVTQISL